MTDSISLCATAAPGDTVETDCGFFTVRPIVWPDNWRGAVELVPVELELLDSLAPANYRLPATSPPLPGVYIGGRVFHGACRVETNGRKPLRKAGARWLRCRIELWDGEGQRQLLRGLVLIER